MNQDEQIIKHKHKLKKFCKHFEMLQNSISNIKLNFKDTEKSQK